MKVIIENRKDKEDYSQTRSILTPNQILADLWSVPEQKRGKIRGPEQSMNEAVAQAIIDEKVNKLRANDGEQVKITFYKVKHGDFKRRVGLTLSGTYDAFGCVWETAQIDQKTFLRHREEPQGPNTLLMNLLTSRYRAVSQRELAKHPFPTPEEPNLRSSDPKHPNAPDKSDETPPLWRRIITNPLTHGLSASLAVGLGCFFAGAGLIVGIGFSLGVGVAIYAGETLYHWRQNKFEKAYRELQEKHSEELPSFDDSEISAYQAGLESKNWLGWGKSFFTAWGNDELYCAGRGSEGPEDPVTRKVLKAS